MKQADFRDMFKQAYKSICTPTVVAYPDPLVYCSNNFFSYEDSRKQRTEP
jgi:hypothetical protein